MTTLSILLPCYNEARTVATMIARLDRVAATLRDSSHHLATEIVAVNDASSDATGEILAALAERRMGSVATLRVLEHDANRGKGAAIRTALKAATGDLWIIQDADLEYDPAEIPMLIAPLLSGRYDAVLGSRFLGGPGERRVLYFWHTVANQILTLASNMLTNLNTTDMETCRKAGTKDVARMLYLTRERFGLEPEIVARFSQMNARICELPISYNGRTYDEGKKIGWRDGVAALHHMLYAHLRAHRQPRIATREYPS